MGMLDRIKRRQLDGFKEFVQNLETTGGVKKNQIFTAGVLEDPIFMTWVMKNLRTYDDFMKLNADDIESVLTHQEQILSMFAKCIHGQDEVMKELEGTIPRLVSKIRDEISYLSSVTPQERDAAKSFILNTARKLQMEEKIHGFKWLLPPMDLFYPKNYKDGKVSIKYENGILAAEGDYLKNQRVGAWTHFYENGKKMAQGDYLNGLKTGVWTFFYINESMRSRGQYKEDLKHGEWSEWDKNGAETISNYSEGVKSA
ncbi:MAG: hypothetical protein AB7I27_00960 [Bacteriovoracaceae bacterium]